MPELCCRTHFSLLEGASSPDELLSAAARAGHTAVGITDRDAVYGIPQAHRSALTHGLSLIVGAMLSLSSGPPVHVWVETAQGWSNLCRLLTAARAAVEKGRAEVSLDRLVAHATGLWLAVRPSSDARTAHALADAFGDRLSVLLPRRGLQSDPVVTEAAESLAARLMRPLLATSEPLFHDASRRPIADVLTCVRRGVTLEQAGRSLSPNAERVLLSPEDFALRFADHPDAVSRSADIASVCAFTLSDLRYRYPHEVVPEGKSAMEHLHDLVEQGLRWRYPSGVPARVREQVAHEVQVIGALDFPSYFLTVHDVVRFARSRGILCQGRGSAANSAVCYALGVTSVDPALQSMLFERFISVERGEPPDIDIDFEHERREEVLQYVYERYGRDRAALVNEVICFRGRSAIRAAGQALGLSLDQVGRLSRATDRWAAGTGTTSSDLVREAGLDPESPVLQRTLEVAEALEGTPRHLSIHVGGFAITEGALIDLVPVEPATMPGRTVLQWDKDDVDIVNFVKVDLLGLGMLTAIRRSFDLVQAHLGETWTLATIPAEDPAVYEMFQAADTVGVFQIESRAQMSMLPRLQPRCFYDLVIEVAIVRPGPIQGGMVHPYLARRRGEAPVTYAHPALVPILERTLGVPLFQEQVMQMAVAVGGFSSGEADNLRRAMGAWRKRGRLQELGERLVAGMIARGIEPDYARAIFSQILGFGEYGFPESHAASFALLVYVSGWLKRHRPAAFAAALINSQPMGFYSPRAILADVQRHGVEVRPVCVHASSFDCTLEPAEGPGAERAAIRVGLRLVTGLGAEAAQRVVDARARGNFVDLHDFVARTGLDRSALRALADANALRDLEPSRRHAAWTLQGQWPGPLFAGLPRGAPVPTLPTESPREALVADYRATGFSLEHHPIAMHRSWLDRQGVHRIGTLTHRQDGSRSRLVGLVSCRQRPGTASGVVFMTLEDETATTNLVVWPKIWKRWRRIARERSILGVTGRVQRDGLAVSVVVERFFPVDFGGDVAIRSRDFH